MRFTPAAPLAALALLPSLAFAQRPAVPAAPPVDAAAISRAADEAAEDLTLTKVFAGLRLTHDQLNELLPSLQDAQSRLQALGRENEATIGRYRPALQEARDKLLAGQSVSERAQAQYAEAVRLAESKRTKLRADLVSGLKRALTKHLGADQEALIIQTARSVAVQERTAGYRAAAMTGAQGGGPINMMGGMLDRVREMSPEEFQQAQGRIAQRMGNGRSGGAGADQIAAMMSTLRAMPADAYQRQRVDLSLQFWDQQATRFGNTLPPNPTAEVDRFIDRYFLSPRAPIAARQRIDATVPR